jgi:ribose transport system ATP-binding protein
MTDIDKRFSGVHALKGVNFDLYEGEIHALVGENGAGKSTLMKALTGIFPKDSGEIHYLGKLFNPKGPKEALDAGIAIVHQELNMMDHLTVAQNLFIGRESTKYGGRFLDEKAQNKRAAELIEKLNMNIDVEETLGKLTVGKQQMVEIAKAVSHDLKVLILDEPTAALTDREIDELFVIMRDLAAKGVAMIYISHRLDEIGMITDRVTVLRDGEYVGTKNTKEITKDEMINMMVGRVIYEKPKSHSNVPKDASVVLKISHLSAGKSVKDVSFDLHRGEILGFAGLMGAGRTETARALYGADKAEGTIEINGKQVFITSPMQAVRHGIGYLSEDRKRFGLAVNLSVTENSVMASYDELVKGFFLPIKEMERVSADYVEKLKIKTPSLEQIVKNLSGVPEAPQGSIWANASTDNYAAAGLAAEKMFAVIKDRIEAATDARPVKIVVLNQDAAGESLLSRGKGFRDTMVKLIDEQTKLSKSDIAVIGNPGYIAADSPRSGKKVIIEMIVPASAAMTDATASANAMLSRAASDNILGIFCSNEATVKGLLAATNDGATLKSNAALRNIVVIGYDAGEAQKNAVRQQYFLGSITQDPYSIGYKAVELAYKAYKGETVADVDTGAKFYDKDNMDDDDIKGLLYD